MFEKMQWVLDSAKNNPSPLRICQIINDSMKKAFAFRHWELDFYRGVLSYTQSQIMKGGRCDDLNMIGACWMRAIGIPVASEFITRWANSNFGGHSWLSLLIENKKNIPFNAAYDNPFLDSLPFKKVHICEAYRRTFANKSTTFLEIHPDLGYCPLGKRI